MGSLWWYSLPEPAEAGAGMWGERQCWLPCPSYDTQQWHLTSNAVCALSKSIPCCRAPHSCTFRLSHTERHFTSVSSGHLHAANSSLFLGSSFQSPCFSTQPPPALADTHFRLWHAGLWHGLSMQVLLCPACHRLATVFSSSNPQITPSISADLTGERTAPGVITSPLL